MKAHPFTQRRQRTVELNGLPNPEALAAVPAHDVVAGIRGMLSGERAMLRDLGFDNFKIEFLIAYMVEECSLRELPERLWCTPKEVERRRVSVFRKITKIRSEIALDESAYKNIRFGTGLFRESFHHRSTCPNSEPGRSRDLDHHRRSMALVPLEI